MSAADWLTSDAVTEALASIKRENDTERSLEREAFEAWAAEQDFSDPFEDSLSGCGLGHQPGCGCH